MRHRTKLVCAGAAVIAICIANYYFDSAVPPAPPSNQSSNGGTTSTRNGADVRQPDAKPTVTVPKRVHTKAEDGVEYAVLSTSDPTSTSPPFTPDEVTSTESTVLAPSTPDPRRERFNANRKRYLMEVVMPRARDCWTSLDGEGTIEFLYLMRHDTGHGPGTVTPTTDIGIETSVSVVASDLTPDQSKRALNCMQDAVDGTSFTTELPDEALGPLVGMYEVWHVGKHPGDK